jgi:hypothetical protein
MRILKRLTQISSAVVRLTIGIGGTVLLILVLKEEVKWRRCKKSKFKT